MNILIILNSIKMFLNLKKIVLDIYPERECPSLGRNLVSIPRKAHLLTFWLSNWQRKCRLTWSCWTASWWAARRCRQVSRTADNTCTVQPQPRFTKVNKSFCWIMWTTVFSSENYEYNNTNSGLYLWGENKSHLRNYPPPPFRRQKKGKG